MTKEELQKIGHFSENEYGKWLRIYQSDINSDFFAREIEEVEEISGYTFVKDSLIEDGNDVVHIFFNSEGYSFE